MPQTLLSWRWFLPAFALACAPVDQRDAAAETTHPAGVADLPFPVVEALFAGEGVDVLVRLDDADVRAEAARAGRDRRVAAQAAEWGVLADAFSAGLPPTIHLERTYEHFPVVVLHLTDLDDAYALAGRPEVLSIEPDVAHTATLTDTLALIGQPAVEADGYAGAGTSVAVLDTGADWSHRDLGFCTAVGTPASCRVAYAADFGPSDGSRDDNGHGTNVAAIVAAVAPGADILALDVFRTDGFAWSTDVLAAIDWVIAHQSVYNIASINLSLGAGRYTAPCADVYSASIASARAAGISVVVASGNDGYTNAIASPACVEDALSVGAVYDTNMGAVGWSNCTDGTTAADKVACFSNTATFLDIVAPGALVTAGGYTMGGTSMASPHVAGAVAVLRSATPDATTGEIEDLLLSSGRTVTDSRTGLTFPRLDLETAVRADADALAADTTRPTNGSVTSAGRDASARINWTGFSDAGTGVSSYRVVYGTAAPSASCRNGMAAYSGTAATHTLTGLTNGSTYLVRVCAIDRAGNTSTGVVTRVRPAPEYAAPTGTISLNDGARSTTTRAVTVTLSASDDTRVASMCLSDKTTCSAWVPYSPTVPWTLSATASSRTRLVHAWFKDVYGNIGPMHTDAIVYEE